MAQQAQKNAVASTSTAATAATAAIAVEDEQIEGVALALSKLEVS